MALFGRKKSGGMLNAIRCDQQEYLVWKWRPDGEANSTKRENAIRWGSSLRVKDGELAVFVYSGKDSDSNQDFIIGPFDDIIKTTNFPILSNILGLAYGGDTPFQAEVYFINLQGNNQIRFGVPYFDVFDPRFLDFGVPVTARGTITFNITDYKSFIKLNRLINFELEDFSLQIRSAVIKYIKAIITNIPSEQGIPVLQLERKVLEINDLIQAHLKPRLEADFGVNLKGFDLDSIEVNKESDGYQELRNVTAEQVAKTVSAQTDVNVKNMADTQRINATNMEETLKIQREEAQRAQKLQTESGYMGVHALNQQTEVLKSAAHSLGQMGSVDGGGGMNPAGMMTGMMLGGAMGQQMAGMVNQVGQMSQSGQATPPPPPNVFYYVSLDGQQSGPFDNQQIARMVQEGQVTKEHFVWREGMPNWVKISEEPTFQSLFATPGSMPPPPPPTA